MRIFYYSPMRRNEKKIEMPPPLINIPSTHCRCFIFQHSLVRSLIMAQGDKKPLILLTGRDNNKSLTYLVDEADALLMYLTTGGGSDLRLDACLQSWSLTAFLICGTLCKLLCIIIYTFKSSASRLLNKQVLREEMGAERGNCYVSHTFRQNNQKSISQYMYYIDHHFPIPT